MAARTTWRGAIELAGFPVNVALYNRVKSSKNQSFKTLGTDGQPIHQVLVEDSEFVKLVEDPHTKVATIGREDTRKGVEVGDKAYKALSEESIEAIASREKSATIEPSAFVPLDTIDLALADRAFTVVPDDKVPGSEKAVEILAAGLHDTGLAYTATITTRAGSRDAILAIYVADGELLGASIPFVEELQEAPTFKVTSNSKAAKLFASFVSELEAPAFDIAAYASEAAAVRQAAIDAALKGETIKVPEAKTPAGDGDLLAALEAAVEEAPKAKAKPKAKKPRARKASDIKAKA